MASSLTHTLAVHVFGTVLLCHSGAQWIGVNHRLELGNATGLGVRDDGSLVKLQSLGDNAWDASWTLGQFAAAGVGFVPLASRHSEREAVIGGGQSYRRIDFAAFFVGDGRFGVSELGHLVGWLRAQVEYMVNGLVRYVSSAHPAEPLFPTVAGFSRGPVLSALEITRYSGHMWFWVALLVAVAVVIPTWRSRHEKATTSGRKERRAVLSEDEFRERAVGGTRGLASFHSVEALATGEEWMTEELGQSALQDQDLALSESKSAAEVNSSARRMVAAEERAATEYPEQGTTWCTIFTPRNLKHSSFKEDDEDVLWYSPGWKDEGSTLQCTHAWREDGEASPIQRVAVVGSSWEEASENEGTSWCTILTPRRDDADQEVAPQHVSTTLVNEERCEAAEGAALWASSLPRVSVISREDKTIGLDELLPQREEVSALRVAVEASHELVEELERKNERLSAQINYLVLQKDEASRRQKIAFLQRSMALSKRARSRDCYIDVLTSFRHGRDAMLKNQEAAEEAQRSAQAAAMREKKAAEMAQESARLNKQPASDLRFEHMELMQQSSAIAPQKNADELAELLNRRETAEEMEEAARLRRRAVTAGEESLRMRSERFRELQSVAIGQKEKDAALCAMTKEVEQAAMLIEELQRQNEGLREQNNQLVLQKATAEKQLEISEKSSHRAQMEKDAAVRQKESAEKERSKRVAAAEKTARQERDEALVQKEKAEKMAKLIRLTQDQLSDTQDKLSETQRENERLMAQNEQLMLQNAAALDIAERAKQTAWLGQTAAPREEEWDESRQSPTIPEKATHLKWTDMDANTVQANLAECATTLGGSDTAKCKEQATLSEKTSLPEHASLQETTLSRIQHDLAEASTEAASREEDTASKDWAEKAGLPERIARVPTPVRQATRREVQASEW